MNPILMQQIGSCFADITTAELALAGWLLLASAVRVPRISRVLCAGLLLGAARAAVSKLSNALPRGISLRDGHHCCAKAELARQRSAMAFSTVSRFRSWIMAAVAAPWSYRLLQGIRQSGCSRCSTKNIRYVHHLEFTTESMANQRRFVPESIADALWRPFAMIDPAPMVHEEMSAPDPRYAILGLSSPFYLVARWACRAHWSLPSPPRNASRIS